MSKRVKKAYVKSSPAPPGVVVSVKFPVELLEKIDQDVQVIRFKTNPYASRGEVVRGIVIEHYREASQ